MNWHRDTGTRKLNTLGDEEQVQTIKAGQTITKDGAQTRAGSAVSERRGEMSIQTKHRTEEYMMK